MSATLALLRHGTHDPTTIVESGHLWHATHTPDGPGTLHIGWRSDIGVDDDEAGVVARAAGPGAAWLLDSVPGMTGTRDRPIDYPEAPGVVRDALHRRSPVRLVACRNGYHQLLPIVLAQRITAGEAIKQWHRLVEHFGAPPPALPGMPERLRLPPEPVVLARIPAYELHPVGIEASRARTLRVVATYAERIWQWSATTEFFDAVQRLPGVGPWTAGSAARVCCADADRIIIGDFHFANSVGWHLTGRARSTDDEMVDLLAPYAGHRGRVQAALVAHGAAPAFGPKRRIIPVARW